MLFYFTRYVYIICLFHLLCVSDILMLVDIFISYALMALDHISISSAVCGSRRWCFYFISCCVCGYIYLICYVWYFLFHLLCMLCLFHLLCVVHVVIFISSVWYLWISSAVWCMWNVSLFHLLCGTSQWYLLFIRCGTLSYQPCGTCEFIFHLLWSLWMMSLFHLSCVLSVNIRINISSVLWYLTIVLFHQLCIEPLHAIFICCLVSLN